MVGLVWREASVSICSDVRSRSLSLGDPRVATASDWRIHRRHRFSPNTANGWLVSGRRFDDRTHTGTWRVGDPSHVTNVVLDHSRNVFSTSDPIRVDHMFGHCRWLGAWLRLTASHQSRTRRGGGYLRRAVSAAYLEWPLTPKSGISLRRRCREMARRAPHRLTESIATLRRLLYATLQAPRACGRHAP